MNRKPSWLLLTIVAALLFSTLGIASVQAESANTRIYEATVEGMT